MPSKFLILIFAALIVFVSYHNAAAQDDEATRPLLTRRDIPATGRQVKDFVPANWKITEETKGDLNGDRLPDVALIIDRENFSPALIVVFQTAGDYELAAIAPAALRCDCGSVLGDGTPNVKIERGQIILDALSGSRDTREITMRFRWDAVIERFQLIGEDYTSRDRAAGGERTVSSNYLTNMQILTISEPKKRDRRKQQRIAKKTVYLDHLDYESHWAKFDEWFESDDFLWK